MPHVDDAGAHFEQFVAGMAHAGRWEDCMAAVQLMGVAAAKQHSTVQTHHAVLRCLGRAHRWGESFAYYATMFPGGNARLLHLPLRTAARASQWGRAVFIAQGVLSSVPPPPVGSLPLMLLDAIVIACSQAKAPTTWAVGLDALQRKAAQLQRGTGTAQPDAQRNAVVVRDFLQAHVADFSQEVKLSCDPMTTTLAHNQAMSRHINNGRWEDAVSAFALVTAPDTASYNVLIKALLAKGTSARGDVHTVLSLMHQTGTAPVAPNGITLKGLVGLAERSGDGGAALTLLRRHGALMDPNVMLGAVRLVTSSGRWADALRWFQDSRRGGSSLPAKDSSVAFTILNCTRKRANMPADVRSRLDDFASKRKSNGL